MNCCDLKCKNVICSRCNTCTITRDLHDIILCPRLRANIYNASHECLCYRQKSAILTVCCTAEIYAWGLRAYIWSKSWAPMLRVMSIISATLFNRPYLQFAAQCIYRCNNGYSHCVCEVFEISMTSIYTMHCSSCDCGFRIKHVPYFYLKTSAHK